MTATAGGVADSYRGTFDVEHDGYVLVELVALVYSYRPTDVFVTRQAIAGWWNVVVSLGRSAR